MVLPSNILDVNTPINWYENNYHDMEYAVDTVSTV